MRRKPATAAGKRQSLDQQRAGQRVGETVNGRLARVLELIARDPWRMSTGEKATAREDLRALAHNSPAGSTVGATYSPADAVLTSDAALRELWKQMRALVRGVSVALPAGREEAVVIRTMEPVGKEYRVRLSLERMRDVDGLAALTLHVVANLIEACDGLYLCRECSHPFLAGPLERRRRLRHPACSQRARDRRRRKGDRPSPPRPGRR